jgi:hypothetical protein
VVAGSAEFCITGGCKYQDVGHCLRFLSRGGIQHVTPFIAGTTIAPPHGSVPVYFGPQFAFEEAGCERQTGPAAV